MSLNPYSLAMLGAVLITSVLAIYAWRRRERTEALVFAWLMAAVALWSVAYGLEIAVRNYDLMKVLLIASYPGIAAIPALWLILVLACCRYDAWLAPRIMMLLFILPGLTILMIATNDLHGLFYTAVTPGVSNGYRYQALAHGPFWWLTIAYSHLAVVIGILLFAHRYYLKAASAERLRIIVLLAGAALPFIVNIAYVAGFRPHGFIDTTPVAFAGMGIILAIGVFGFRFFDIAPLALEVLFQHILQKSQRRQRILGAGGGISGQTYRSRVFAWHLSGMHTVALS